jgi:hypothetical protein
LTCETQGQVNGYLRHCFGLLAVSEVDNPLRRGFWSKSSISRQTGAEFAEYLLCGWGIGDNVSWTAWELAVVFFLIPFYSSNL